MKKTIIFLFIINLGYSQGESNIWYFGLNGGLNFNSGFPTPESNGKVLTLEGCATMCANTGELLFYTDGITVWNKLHQIMLNGTNLKGDPSSTQSAVIVPKPGSDTNYYIFTTAAASGSDGIQFSEVNMSLANGLGAVTTNKNNLLYSPVCEKVTAVKKADCNGYWALTHAFGSDAFLAYEITNSGVNQTPVISHIGISIYDGIFASQGHLKFSPNGEKIAFANTYDGLFLFDFNLQTGVVTNPVTVTTKGCYGVEFSPSNNILYASCSNGNSNRTNYIYQYDLNAINIEDSEIELFYNNNEDIGALQLASDGKIYCTSIYYKMGSPPIYSSSLGVISNPDLVGQNCLFYFNFTPISGLATLGLPQSIPSTFNNYSIHNETACFGEAIVFSVPGCPEVLSAFWDFGDGNTSTSIVGQNTYLLPGTYTVTVQFTTVKGAYTRTKNITIIQNPIANPIPVTYFCEELNLVHVLTTFNSQIIGNQTPTHYSISYFSNIDNATYNYNPITSLPLFVGVNTVYARIQTINNPDCFDVTIITIIVGEKPLVIENVEFQKCDEFPLDLKEQFNLSTKDDEIVQNNNINEFTVSYHSTILDAQNNLSPLNNNNYINTLPEETLYVRVQNNSSPNCYKITQLKISVVQKPILTAISDFIVCDDEESNDGIASIDLNTKITEILNGQSPLSFNVKYYQSLNDAQNNSNPIFNNFTNITNPQDIFVRISNNLFEECYVVGSFQIIVKSIPSFYINDIYALCENGDPITINIPSGFSNYLWSTGNTTNSVTINDPGNYSVTASIIHNNLICSLSKNFAVIMSNPATITQIVTNDWNGNNNNFVVNTIGLGNYEYSLDGLNYQDSNQFENLNPGEYTVTVRDKNGCGIVAEQLYLLSYPKYFTPNGDNNNDYWKIKYSNHEPNLFIKIYDRYGKFITSFYSDSMGWDGTFNNFQLPADDYWFIVIRQNEKIHKGHFTLKR